MEELRGSEFGGRTLISDEKSNRRVKWRWMSVTEQVMALALVASLASCSPPPEVPKTPADELVGQLRETLSPMPMDEFCATGIARADGKGDPGFVCPTAQEGKIREKVYRGVIEMGPAGAAALGRAYKSEDVRLRQGAALALEMLGGHYDSRYPILDLEPALPALEQGLNDRDESVRSWSAQALGHLGSRAAPAVPALIQMLSSTSEGERNSACLGLKGIGPAAHAALPALNRALSDPSRDVRGFAQFAITAIGS